MEPGQTELASFCPYESSHYRLWFSIGASVFSKSGVEASAKQCLEKADRLDVHEAVNWRSSCETKLTLGSRRRLRRLSWCRFRSLILLRSRSDLASHCARHSPSSYARRSISFGDSSAGSLAIAAPRSFFRQRMREASSPSATYGRISQIHSSSGPRKSSPSAIVQVITADPSLRFGKSMGISAKSIAPRSPY